MFILFLAPHAFLQVPCRTDLPPSPHAPPPDRWFGRPGAVCRARMPDAFSLSPHPQTT